MSAYGVSLRGQDIPVPTVAVPAVDTIPTLPKAYVLCSSVYYGVRALMSDSISIEIGNVHGRYTVAESLDLNSRTCPSFVQTHAG